MPDPGGAEIYTMFYEKNHEDRLPHVQCSHNHISLVLQFKIFKACIKLIAKIIFCSKNAIV